MLKIATTADLKSSFLNQLKRWMDETGSVVFLLAVMDYQETVETHTVLRYEPAAEILGRPTPCRDRKHRCFTGMVQTPRFLNACVHATCNAAKDEHKAQFLTLEINCNRTTRNR